MTSGKRNKGKERKAKKAELEAEQAKLEAEKERESRAVLRTWVGTWRGRAKRESYYAVQSWGCFDTR